ncbi:hypothetical protein LINPERHAP1_LOCUS31449 [Linum perenne]
MPRTLIPGALSLQTASLLSKASRPISIDGLGNAMDFLVLSRTSSTLLPPSRSTSFREIATNLLTGLLAPPE